MKDLEGDIKLVLIAPEANKHLIDDDFCDLMDHVHIVPELDLAACEDIMSRHLTSTSFDRGSAVICTDEPVLITCAMLRKEFGIRGNLPHQYVSFHDKRVMKQFLKAHGIRCPSFIDLNGTHTTGAMEHYHARIAEALGTPYVVKPIMNGGSTHVDIIGSGGALRDWHQKHFDASSSYSAEEFIAGEMFHCDSFVNNGEVVFARPSQYLYPNLDFTKGRALGSFPLLESDRLYQRIIEFNKRVLKALHAPDGALHLEMMINDKGELFFIEIGARPPGAAVNVMHERNFGINLYELTLRQGLGIPMDFTERPDLYHAWIYLSTVPGKVTKLNEPRLHSSMEIKWNIKPGNIIRTYPSSVTNGDSARLHIFNRDHSKLEEDILVLKTHRPYDLEPLSN